jgi:ABC-type polysaccharide/polyol phosphate export permease
MLWNFFAEGTMTGLGSILSKAGILTKIKLPVWAIVVASSVHICISFLINLIILILFFIYYAYYPTIIQILGFSFYIICTYLLIVSISLITSVLYVRFRDLNQIWEVILLAGFYACPIIYPLYAIPEKFHWILHLNPMTFLVQYTQEVMFNNYQNFSLSANLIYLTVLFCGFAFSILFFKQNRKKLIENI